MGTCRGNQSDQLASRVSAPNRVQLVKYAPGPRHFGDSPSIDRRRISTRHEKGSTSIRRFGRERRVAMGSFGRIRLELSPKYLGPRICETYLPLPTSSVLYSSIVKTPLSFISYFSNNVPFIFVCQRCGAGCFCGRIFASS
jgi:hypothetical protein